MSRRALGVLVAALAVFALPACHDDGLDLHNCATTYTEFWHLLELRLRHTEPSTCPVYIPSAGATRQTGATVEDGGSAEMSELIIKVEDHLRRFVNGDRQNFRRDPEGRWTASVFFSYEAGRVDFQSDFATITAFAPSNFFGEAVMTITYTNQVRLSVGGPGTVASGSTVTWTANVTAGEPPFTYRWYRDWEMVGTEPSYTEEVNGEGTLKLRLDVRDARGEAASYTKQVLISNCGTQVSC